MQIPYLKHWGIVGKLALGLLELKGAIAASHALAAEQKASQDQQRSSSFAQQWFINNFNQSEKKLATAISEVERAVIALQTTASTMIDQADDTQKQSSAMSSMAQFAADGVATVADEAMRLSSNAEHLQGQVGNARQVTTNAVTMVEQTDQTILKLSDCAGRIENVVNLITTIAHQTKMLALNATIEAHRAGDAGKGFAVVAEEVKTLSSQTHDATAKIGADVNQMGHAVERSSSSMTSISTAIRSIEGLTSDLQSLVIEESRVASEISRQAEEVSTSVQTMSEHASALENSSIETRSMANNLMIAAQGLAGQSEILSQSVTGFLQNIREGAIKIGVMHSLSGTMASSEQPLKDLLVMLVEQVNRSGGLLGRPLELVIVNPQSDWAQYEPLATQLLAHNKVSVLFGCWTSISRKAVLPVVEKHDGLLFYPVQYEGEEQSPNIFYTGATPNQQAIPAVDFLLGAAGGRKKRFALIGTDYIYPQTTNQILKGYLIKQGIGRDDIFVNHTPFSHEDWGQIIKQVRKFAKGAPTAIISTINGDANVHFYRELKKQGIKATELPVMAFSVGENEAAAMPPGLLTGHYVAWNYLMSISSPDNNRFREQWCGYMNNKNAVTDDPMEATWIGFNLWCSAVRQAGSVEPKAVRVAVAGQRLRAPSGFDVTMDSQNHHLHKPVFIGQVTPSATIEIISRSDAIVPPSPFSPYLKSA